MPFSPDQTAALAAKLDASHVKKRAQAGRQLSYIEGWHAIAEANRIFGFDGWDRETLELRQLGEPREVDGKWRIAYMAKVRITVYSPGDGRNIGAVLREGTGYGSGIDKDLGSAHESAIKEAETDAMKRALMTFGNPFGLALYDKEQEGVERNGNGHSNGHATSKPGNGADKVAEFWQRSSYTIPVPKFPDGGYDWVKWSGTIRKAAATAPDPEKRQKVRRDNAASLAGLKEIAPGEHERIAALIAGKPLANAVG